MSRQLVVAFGLTLFSLTALRAQRVAVEVASFPAFSAAHRVTDLIEANDGRIWCAFRDRVQWHDAEGGFELKWSPEDQARSRTLRCLAAADDGALWIGGAEGVWYVPRGGQVAVPHADERATEVWEIVVDPSGTAWVGTTRGLLRCRPDGTTRAVPLPWDNQGVTRLATFGDRIWCWNGEGLWWSGLGDPDTSWQVTAGAPAGVRRLLRWRDLTVVASATGVFQVSDRGEWTALYHGQELQSITGFTSCAGAFWFASHAKVWKLPHQGGELREVQLFQRGKSLEAGGISAMFGDRQGLLWFAGIDNVYRAGLIEGVENVMIDAMDEDQFVTALLETGPNEILAAQTQGGLLTTSTGGWQTLHPPWSTSSESKVRIECLVKDAQGRVWVGTRTHGVWRRERGEWRQIGAEVITGARSILQAPDGHVWLASMTEVWRIDGDDRSSHVPIRRPHADVDPRPCVLSSDGTGRVWLGTYRESLLRYDEDARSMVACDVGDIGSAVLGLQQDRSDPNFLWALTTVGVHRVDAMNRSVTTLIATPRNGTMRSLAQASDGSLWIAHPRHLMHLDPRTGHSQLVAARMGAHPHGYGHRATLSRSNHEIWLGSKGGYTRIQPGSDPSSAHPIQLLGFETLSNGSTQQRDVEHGLFAQVEVAPGPVRIRPRLIDRAGDYPPAADLMLRDHATEQVYRSRTGQFDDLPFGSFEMTVLVTGCSGETQPIPMGHLIVVAPSAVWPWWLLSAIAMGGAGAWFAVHRNEQSRQRRRRRRIVVEQMLTEQRLDTDQLLDVSFLAVAIAEECARRTDAKHASIWIRDRTRRQRLLLAEFGSHCPDAEQRADCCCGNSSPHDSLHVQRVADGTDLLVHIRDRGNLEFEILLHAPAAVGPQTLESVRTATLPVLAAIRKHEWLGRLESDKAETAASLVADVHDLRSPLTTLRLCASELLATGEQCSPAQRELTRLLASAAERVVAAIDELVENQNRTAIAASVEGDPKELVEERIRSLIPSARRKGIAIALHATDKQASATFDPVWLGRVIENLVGNAIKYAPLRSTVTVTCELAEGQFLMHVDDQGPGFAESELEAVFLPGVVGSAKPTGTETQSGMGLWIARQAMRSMGGNLRIEPTRRGLGARVTLSLPVRTQKAAVETDDPRPPA